MLVEKRKQAGITQKQLASKLHLRQNIISKIETCERRIDLLELINYCGGVNYPFLSFVQEVSEKVIKDEKWIKTQPTRPRKVYGEQRWKAAETKGILPPKQGEIPIQTSGGGLR